MVIRRTRAIHWLSLSLMILSLPFILHAMTQIKSNADDVMQWLPPASVEREVYDDFVARFGVDDVVMVSWPGCTLDDTRLDQFAAHLAELTAQDAMGDRPALVERIITGRDLLRKLTAQPYHLKRHEVLQRLQGVMVGRELRTTSAIVVVSDTGRGDWPTVIALIHAAAQRVEGLDARHLRLGGNVYMGVSIKQAAKRAIVWVIGPSIAIALTVGWLFLGSWYLLALVSGAGIYTALASLALVYYTGSQLNSLMLTIPNLALVLTLSGAIHLVNYYRDVAQTHDPADAARRALRAGWLPCALAVGTTAIGFASLGLSQLQVVQLFGLYAAATLLISIAVVLGWLPAMLTLWPPAMATALPVLPPRHVHWQRTGGLLQHLAHGVVRYRRWIIFTGLAVLLLTAYGLTQIRTSMRLERYFRSDTPVIRNLQWLESHIGPMRSLEVILSFDANPSSSFFYRLELVNQVHQALQALPYVSSVMSTLTTLPAIPQPGSQLGDMKQQVRRAVFRRVVEQQQQRFYEGHFLTADQRGEHWRLTVRTPTFSQHALHRDVTAFADTIRDRVQQVLRGDPRWAHANIEIAITGISALFYRAQRHLLRHLTYNTLLAFGAISLIFMIILGSVREGCIAMLPNMFPIVVVFGSLGLLQIQIDLGMIITASIALGIAVDDTLHFLTWYRRLRRTSASAEIAVTNTYHYCAKAMIQTSLICGLGLLMFAPSSFLPISRFGVLMCILLLAALVGDLLLLPAILASPRRLRQSL